MANRSKEVFMGLADRLKELRRERGLTQKELAEQLGKSESAVRMWELGKSEPDLGTLKRLSTLYGIGADGLMGIGRDFTGVRVPVLRNITSYLSQGEGKVEVVDYEMVSACDDARGELLAYRLSDGSMEPRMAKGDTVILLACDDVESGDVAVFALRDGETVCRRVIKTEGGVFLHASNPNHPPIYYSAHQLEAGEANLVGKVIELRARF